MLKALGGSRSVYSIEERGIARTGITRSGKRHFQFSLPKLVNGLKGMNNQSQSSDHVAEKKSHSSTGTTLPVIKRKNFAKKSTGNNVKHTISKLRSAADKSSQQHPKKNLHSSVNSTSISSASDSQTRSVQIAKNLNIKESETIRPLKDASRAEDGSQPCKKQKVNTKDNDPSNNTHHINALERKDVTDEAKERGESFVHSSKGQEQQGGISIQSEVINVRSVKDLTNWNGNNKENHQKSKEPQNPKEWSSGELPSKLKIDPNTTSLGKEGLSVGLTPPKNNSTKSKEIKKERNCDDGHEGTNKSQTTMRSNEVPRSIVDHLSSNEQMTSRLLDASHSPTTSSKDTRKVLTMEEHKSLPKKSQAKDVKRRRATTPTPESPLKRTVLGRLSRKRHRSASPIPLLSSIESKAGSRIAMQIAKRNRESIKLDSKNFEKVRNACKNAISQRKEKASLDKGNIAQKAITTQSSLKTYDSKEKINKSATTDEVTINKIGGTAQLCDKNEPAIKKPKLLSVNDLNQAVTLDDAAATTISASRSSDSEDGLTKLMKDFQSAMSSSSIKKYSKATLEVPLREKHRYVSKKTSGYLVNGKSASSTSTPKKESKTEDAPVKMITAQAPCLTNELNSLQTEAISSDEDFELTQERQSESMSVCASSKVMDQPKLPSDSEECHGIDETPSPDKFVVVDEVGFTPSDSNSLQDVFPCSMSDVQTPSPDGHCSKNQKLDGQQLSTTVESPLNVPNNNKIQTETSSSCSPLSERGISGQAVNKSSLKVCPSDAAVGVAECVQTGLKRSFAETDIIVEEGKKFKMPTGVGPQTTRSTFAQTDDLVEKKDEASETTDAKPEVKDQSFQFKSSTNDIDPEEITPIVTAMFESECEEKERLKKSLDDKIAKEEKWRSMVKDLCRQLRELRQQLAKKEEKQRRHVGINTVTETSPLPVIISTQATQTEDCQHPEVACSVATNSDPSPLIDDQTSITKPDGTFTQAQTVRCVSPSSIKTSANDQSKLNDAATPSAKVVMIDSIKSTRAVQSEWKNITSPVRSQSAPNGEINGTKVTAKRSPATEVIDLTDSEDMNPVEQTAAVKCSTMQSRHHLQPAGNTHIPSTAKPPTVPFKPNIIQPMYTPVANEQPQQNIIRPTLLHSNLPQVPSLQTVKTRTQPIHTSSAQNMQRIISNRLPQNQVSMNHVNMPSATHVVSQVINTQPNQTVPPPLQPAPVIAGAIYKPQTTQLLSPISNLGMLVRAQGAQRQDMLSGVSQQVAQHHGFNPQQQQHVHNGVLLDEFKRGMMNKTLPTYQGHTNIIIPSSSHQVTTVPIRLPQVLSKAPSTLQNQKIMLEKRRDEFQQKLQQAYLQQHAQKKMEYSKQLHDVMNELKDLEAKEIAQMQVNRNLKLKVAQTPPASAIVSQAHRLPPPPAYSSTIGTVLPVSPVITSAMHPQTSSTSQQREVVNGVKQFIPLPSLGSQPTASTIRVFNGRTCFPNSRQGIDISAKVNHGNAVQHVLNINTRGPPSKHPAALPILQSFPSSVEKSSLLPPPSIRISHSPEGVVLSWNINTSSDHPTVRKYFLYAYQVLNTPPSTSHWKRIGEVGALPPPMACTLNQFQPGSTYFLAICAVDVYDRPGAFSKTEEVVIPN